MGGRPVSPGPAAGLTGLIGASQRGLERSGDPGGERQTRSQSREAGPGARLSRDCDSAECYQLPLVGQPPLPATVQVRVEAPPRPLLVITKVWFEPPLLAFEVAVTV